MTTTVTALGREAMAVLLRHRLFAAVVIVGAALRLLAMATYRPAFMFYWDSYAYIIGAQRFQPPNDRPFGYSALLRVASHVGDLGLVVFLQHLTGVVLAIAVYAVLRKRGAPAWLGTLAAAPLLLDAYLIQIEHNILSETMFAALLLGAVLIATREHLSPAWAATAGGFLAAAAVTRTVAIPIAALFIGYFIVRRVGLRPVLAFGTALLIPIAGYMAWFASVYGVFATSDSGGRFLYGRVAVFADCDPLELTANEAKLCDNSDPALRPNANFYVWSSDSPLRSIGLGSGSDQVAAAFSRKVILDQPVTYGRYVLTDTAHYFAPGRYLTRVDSPDTPWRFPTIAANSNGSTAVAHNDLAGAPVPPVVLEGPATFLRAYQSIVFTQGPVLLLGLILGVAAGWLERGRRRWDGPFAAAVGLAVIAIPSLTVMFDYRYGLPAIPLLAYAGGIGGTALLARQRARVAERARIRAGENADDAGATTLTGSRRHRRPVQTRPLLLPGAVGALAVVLLAVVALSPMVRNLSYERYVGNRAELGTLGPALGPAQPVAGLPGVTLQPFVTGAIVAAGGGAVAVPSRYLDAVDEIGGMAVIGAPRDREQPSTTTSGERFVPFTDGIVYWSRLAGTRVVSGAMYDAWSPRTVRAKLKEPVSAPRATADGATVQQFIGGSITRFANGSLAIDVEPTSDDPVPGDSNPPGSSSGVSGDPS